MENILPLRRLNYPWDRRASSGPEYQALPSTPSTMLHVDHSARKTRFILLLFLLGILCYLALPALQSQSMSFTCTSLTEDPAVDDDESDMDLFKEAVMELHVPQFDQLSAADDCRFNQFFHSEAISIFGRNYRQACVQRQNQDNFKFFGALVNGTPADGFGSVISNALNAYLIARDPSVNRTFRLLEAPSKFAYLSPSYFFYDFAANSPCPLFTNLESPDSLESDLLESPPTFHVQVNQTTQLLNFTAGDSAVVAYFGQGWLDFRNAVQDLGRRNGHNETFTAKSALVRAMWNPKSFLKKLLRILWWKLTGGRGPYLAVHLRRGDKIATNEMQKIPVKQYLLKLTTLCDAFNNVTCPRNVFVIHDDARAFRKLKSIAGVQFLLFELSDLLVGDEFDQVREHILTGKRGGDAWSWERHSRELVLSMTLAAMADKVVCTFSSNICRFIALIHGDLSAFHSLDEDWYAL